MRFLIALRHPGYARYLQSTVRELCERGHEIVVLVGIEASETKSHATLLNRFSDELDQLADELDGRLTIRPGAEPRGSRRRSLGGSLRGWLDCLRFLEPEFDEAPKLRARALSQLPAALREPTETAAASPEFRRSLAALIRSLERSLPVPDEVREVVEEIRPDAVIVCPLIERRSPQANYLRAAHELGIPGAVCVASWDNLTTSSLIHGEPDLVTVWNEAQRQEAIELHGIEPGRVVATGAPLYDRWFEQRPSTSREEFCQRIGLPSDRPFVLYVCSSGFIAPDEADWIPRWIEIVRGSGASELEEISVLIRPHPQHRLLDDSPAAERLEQIPGVAIHPREGALTIGGTEIADNYDSIHHSAAVVGVNTSAMIETAIVGRGVHVLLTKRYRDTQEGVPHFAHLRSAGGGLIEVTRKQRQHVAGRARAVRGEDRKLVAERSRSFLEAFVRPQGLEQAATPLLIDQLEQLAEIEVPPTEPASGAAHEQILSPIATLESEFGLTAGQARRDSQETQPPEAQTTPHDPRREHESIIAFVHIQRTAGATVREILADAFSSDAMLDAGNYFRRPDGVEERLTHFPKPGWDEWRRRGGRIVVGHVPYGLYKKHLPTDTRYFTFLREPVDRVISHFHGPLGRKLGPIPDSLEEAVVDARLPQLNNLATRYLCGDPSPLGELLAGALDAAKENLTEFALVGIRERFDESMVLMQRVLGLELDSYLNRHVSVGRPAVEEVPDEVRALIAEHNQLDAELYAFALSLLDDAVAAAGDDFSGQVEALRAASAAAGEDAIEAAREWLERELPVGTAKPKAALVDRASAAGIPFGAVKKALRPLSVRVEFDPEGDPIWSRPEADQVDDCDDLHAAGPDRGARSHFQT